LWSVYEIMSFMWERKGRGEDSCVEEGLLHMIPKEIEMSPQILYISEFLS